MALGPDHAINYKTQDFVAEALRLTEWAWRGCHLDMVAGDYVAREVQCLAEDGRLVIIAVQGGIEGSFNAGGLMRRLTMTGSPCGPIGGVQVRHCTSCLPMSGRCWPLVLRQSSTTCLMPQMVVQRKPMH